MQEDESVVAYASKMSSLAAQREKLSDNIKMVRIISSLTSRFQNFKTVWYNIKEGRTIENLMAKLQLEEDKYKMPKATSIKSQLLKERKYQNVIFAIK